jgi:hypothetical protein
LRTARKALNSQITIWSGRKAVVECLYFSSLHNNRPGNVDATRVSAGLPDAARVETNGNPAMPK